MRVWLKRLLYPVVMGASYFAVVALLGRGVPMALAVVLVTGAAAVLIIGLERVAPFTRAWQPSRGDIVTDAGHLVVSNVALEVLRVLSVAPLLAASAWLSRAFGVSVWPERAPLIAQLALALLLIEFGGYWAHRLQHEVALLWRLHAPHHSAPRLYWLTSARNHAGDVVLTGIMTVLPLTLLGAGEAVVGLVAALAGVHFMLQHANIDLRLGPLNVILSGPEVHRWHHSPRIEEANGNYGGILLVWDRLFGTWIPIPADRAPPTELGLLDMPGFPMGFWGQLLSPFRRSLWGSKAPRP